MLTLFRSSSLDLGNTNVLKSTEMHIWNHLGELLRYIGSLQGIGVDPLEIKVV